MNPWSQNNAFAHTAFAPLLAMPRLLPPTHHHHIHRTPSFESNCNVHGTKPGADGEIKNKLCMVDEGLTAHADFLALRFHIHYRRFDIVIPALPGNDAVQRALLDNLRGQAGLESILEGDLQREDRVQRKAAVIAAAKRAMHARLMDTRRTRWLAAAKVERAEQRRRGTGGRQQSESSVASSTEDGVFQRKDKKEVPLGVDYTFKAPDPLSALVDHTWEDMLVMPEHCEPWRANTIRRTFRNMRDDYVNIPESAGVHESADSRECDQEEHDRQCKAAEKVLKERAKAINMRIPKDFKHMRENKNARLQVVLMLVVAESNQRVADGKSDSSEDDFGL